MERREKEGKNKYERRFMIENVAIAFAYTHARDIIQCHTVAVFFIIIFCSLAEMTSDSITNK